MNSQDISAVQPTRAAPKPSASQQTSVSAFVGALRSDLDDILRARLKEELDDVIRLLIDRALLVDGTHEANILLDALVLLNRDTADTTTPITAEERLSVMPEASDDGV